MYCTECGFPTEYCIYSPVHSKSQNISVPAQTKVPVVKDLKIIITKKKVSGNKKVTLIKNLNTLLNTIQMKEMVKKFAKTIACGSSIIKNGQGQEDITVQTQNEQKVIEILQKSGIPKDKIELDTKNK
ncbi:density-regulated protein [Nematocida sp. AWRm80]|nr:density-regulated protein [Nematocida sp. AWRm80]